MNNADSTFLFYTCVWGLILGCIPGAIAQKKGHSFVAWWLFGAAIFVVALPISIMLKEKENHS